MALDKLKTTMIIDGEGYTLTKNGIMVNTSDLIRTQIRREDAKNVHKTSAFNSISMIDVIGTGFLTYVNINNYLYVKSGKMKTHLVGSRTPLDVIFPRFLFLKDRSSVSACRITLNGDLRNIPLTNAYEASRVNIPGLGNAPMSQLCLGDNLSEVFARETSRGVHSSIEGILTSLPNNDLGLNARIDEDALGRFVNNIKRQKLITSEELREVNRIATKNSEMSTDSHSLYNQLIVVASAFTAVTPELVEMFWDAVLVDGRWGIRSEHQTMRSVIRKLA